MASAHSSKAFIYLTLVLTLCPWAALGEIACENLDRHTCAFAVSSSGMRCVLEKHMRRGGREEYTCGTSEIEAEGTKGWVETDDCVRACGLDRNSLGISSDSLLESHFTQKLCSSPCYHGCPSIVDLYFNLAAGEGLFLPKLCESQGTNARRSMAEIRSSGAVVLASGPAASSEKLAAWGPTQYSTELGAFGPAP